MYARSARVLFSDTLFVIMLRSEKDFGVMYTLSARTLLSDAHLVIRLRSDTDFGVMYTRSARILLRSGTKCWSSVHRFC